MVWCKDCCRWYKRWGSHLKSRGHAVAVALLVLPWGR